VRIAYKLFIVENNLFDDFSIFTNIISDVWID
jgi:hypothetical protein